MTLLEYKILQSHYPQGASIVLDSTSTGGMPVNSVGKVVSINKDIDTVLVDFESNGRMSLIYGKDMFHRKMKQLCKLQDGVIKT